MHAPIECLTHARDFFATIRRNDTLKLNPYWADDHGHTPKEYREVISDIWDTSPALPIDSRQREKVDRAYTAFARELRKQFAFLVQQHEFFPDIFPEIVFTDDDPTHTTEDGKLDAGSFFEDVRTTGVLRIFRSQPGDHPILAPYSEIGAKIDPYVRHNDRWENLNSIFRAVHDCLGHLATGNGFGWKGETAAYYSHASTFSAEAIPALFCETVAQQCYFYEHDRNYADVQKVIAYHPNLFNAPPTFK